MIYYVKTSYRYFLIRFDKGTRHSSYSLGCFFLHKLVLVFESYTNVAAGVFGFLMMVTEIHIQFYTNHAVFYMPFNFQHGLHLSNSEDASNLERERARSARS